MKYLSSYLIFTLFTSFSAVFCMAPQKTVIHKKLFQGKEKTFLSHALSRWTEVKINKNNDLYDAFTAIQEYGIETLLNDTEAFKHANQMLITMKRDNRYYEAQELLKNTLTPEVVLAYKKKIMILGLQILVTYAGIRIPEEIKPTAQSTGIVSNEQAFLKVNRAFEPNKLAPLKGALLLLSLELSKVAPTSEKDTE